MDRILDFGSEFDVALFDQVAKAFFEGNIQVQGILVQFTEHPQAWTRVHAILERSQDTRAQQLALNILNKCVDYRWKVLPNGERDGIKSFIINLIISFSSDSQAAEEKKAKAPILNKLNMVLIQIVKKEWPHNWPSFIPDLVNSSRSSEALCANNMKILCILSEEVFDFSPEQMTTSHVKQLKQSLNEQFTLIYQLCEFIMGNSQDKDLLLSTLTTLLRFLRWIPAGYIFETELIHTLAAKFFPAQVFQNKTLECLSEIAAIPIQESKYNAKFGMLFTSVIEQCSRLLPESVNIAEVYRSGHHESQTFVRHLSIFITSFLHTRMALLENGDTNARRLLFQALMILLRISDVDDRVVFKICLEFWNWLVKELHLSDGQAFMSSQQTPRSQLFTEILSRLRGILITHMAKPKEVLIVEDDQGNIVRETLQDSDSVTLYKNMKECLTFLTHLGSGDTIHIMMNRLNGQINGTEWSWKNMNTLCWAIGSISGTLPKNQEAKFLVGVLKPLLNLTKHTRGKDNKAVIASNIMYIVGQYPRFLRQHWRFLHTVVNKLFQFMHESFDGVQDMACDTYMKIVQKCAKEFVIPQDNNPPWIQWIIQNIANITSDLKHQQIHTFYEATSMIVAAQRDQQAQQDLIFALMQLPNQEWARITAAANSNVDVLWDLKLVKTVAFVLKTNTRVARALKAGFKVQLGRMYTEMLQIYQLYSGYISNRIQQQGPTAVGTVVVRSMIGVKKECLTLLRTFVENCPQQDFSLLIETIVPALFHPVLNDYKSGVPEARGAEVLLLFASIISTLRQQSVNLVPQILADTFKPTLDMITTNFEDFPDHRHSFFTLISAINSHAFPALLQLEAPQFKQVMDSIIWALKHIERNVADTGLQCLYALLKNISQTQITNVFYSSFYISIVQDILGVLTDTFHKPGFHLHASILGHLFLVVREGKVGTALWDTNSQQFNNNQAFVQSFVAQLLTQSFSHLTRQTIEHFVTGCFALASQTKQLQVHIRDFLIQLKEFNAAGSDNSDLFEKEGEQNQQQTQ